jgi:hypothetical protein
MLISLHVFLTVVVIFVILVCMVSMRFDLGDYRRYINATNVLLESDDLANLLNANALGNLPSININSNNAIVNNLQSCRDGPIFMGATGSEFSCRQLCGANASLLQIGDRDEVFSQGEKLQPGTWCTLNRPNCNLNTTYAVATANSVACRSRYPRMFGGVEGNRVIACNNSRDFSVTSVLWDNLLNRRVTEFTRVNDDEDERLPSGLPRFECRFGDDDTGNQYVPHIIDRLHPMRNYCSSSILEASRQIQLLPDGSCDCGNYQDTRVRNRLENDKFSECTNCFHLRIDANDTNRVGFRCFNMRSPYSMAFSSVPCFPNRFLEGGNFCEPMNLLIQEQLENRPFEFHPVLQFSGRLQLAESFGF